MLGPSFWLNFVYLKRKDFMGGGGIGMVIVYNLSVMQCFHLLTP